MLILCEELSLLTLKSTRHKQTLPVNKILSFKVDTRDADKFLARPGRKTSRKHVRDARDFNKIGDAICHQLFLPARQGKAPKEIHAILTLASFIPDLAKDLSAPM